jgi:predicted permease
VKFRILAARLVAMFSSRRRDGDLNDEIRTHLDLLADEYFRNGMSRRDARAEARRQFGGVDQTKETYRDQRGWPFLETLAQDVRYAVRFLSGHPAFTAVVVLSLSLGIGANTAIFSMLNAVVFRPLPVAEPSELFLVRQQAQTVTPGRFSYRSYEQLRDSLAGSGNELAGMSRVARTEGRLDGDRAPEAVNVQLVSGEYFSTLGVAPAVGRLLTGVDNQRVGGHPVAVLSEGFWKRRFGGAASVVGAGLRINGAHFTVVGVTRAGFAGVWLESPVDVWIPLVMQGDVRYSQNYSADRADTDKPWASQPRIWWLDLIVRAKPDPTSASTMLNAAYRRELTAVAETIGDSERRRLFLQQRLVLASFARGFPSLRLRFQTPLFVLLGMASMILVIACVNTANLLLARAASRRREMAVRLSMGASRARLIQQLLTESFVLIALAAVSGMLLARWAGDRLVRMTLAAPAAPFSTDVDATVLGFAAAVSVITGLLCGLAPALRTARVELGEALRASSRSVHGSGRMNAPKLLVACQVALSLLLVVGAALFAKSFRNLTQLDLGFATEHLVSAAINPRIAGYQLRELPALYDRLVDRVKAIPGVQSATVAACGLVSGCRSRSDGIKISGYEPRSNEQVVIQFNLVGAGYISTVGMRLVAGRDLTPDDERRATRVALINETFARRYFANRSAIGERFGERTIDTEIVGVVQDARVNSVQEPAEPMAFVPMSRESPLYVGALDVRASGDPRSIAAALRNAVAEAEPSLPIDRITMLSARVGDALSQERVVAALTTAFGALALGLACVGLFGVMSYHVARRSSEFGLRMALGAPRASVLWMTFRESLVVVVIGLGVGLPAVFASGRLVGSMLFETRANDPVIVVSATLALAAVAAVAGLIPALRASRVDPIVALRQD